MRPVRKGPSPYVSDLENYEDAKPDLMLVLGDDPAYCSYCERVIYTYLALEHIQPKGGPHGRPGLKGRWSNFLLACINCNSTKKDKKVDFDKLFFPDRDNTFHIFVYVPNGQIRVSAELSDEMRSIAEATLKLTGLDKGKSEVYGVNGELVAIDRVSQRRKCWLKALDARIVIEEQPKNLRLREMTVNFEKTSGLFSIWMAVFADDIDMRQRLIRAFPGTEASGCFGMTTGESISPAPNPDNLEHGGKI